MAELCAERCDSVEHHGFRYDFTVRELMYFLFSRKKCWNCGHKMLREKTYETVTGSTFSSRSNAPFAQNARIKHYIFKYRCPVCGFNGTLQELATVKR